MSVPVLLSFTIGLPIALLALGVFYHGYVVARQSAIDPLDAHVAGLASGQADAMVAELQRSMDQIHAQLTQQRQSLSGMLSDADRASRLRSREAAATATAVAAGGLDFSAGASGLREPARDVHPAASGAARPARSASAGTTGVSLGSPAAAPLDPAADLRNSVARLAAEGLSDRAIARQLHVGLEEVRMTRTRTGNAS